MLSAKKDTKSQLTLKKKYNKAHTNPVEKRVMYKADFTANLYVFLKFNGKVNYSNNKNNALQKINFQIYNLLLLW